MASEKENIPPALALSSPLSLDSSRPLLLFLDGRKRKNLDIALAEDDDAEMWKAEWRLFVTEAGENSDGDPGEKWTSSCKRMEIDSTMLKDEDGRYSTS